MAAAAACSPARREPPMPRSTQAEFGDLALHVEGLLVRRAQRADHAVDRQLHLAALQPFLQFGLRVLGGGLHLRVDLDLLEQAAHQRLGRGVAGVEVDRADHGLQRVGQDRRPLAARRSAPRPRPAAARRQARSTASWCRVSCLTRLARTRDRSPSGSAARRSYSRCGHGQVEHRIAQELEPLVVVGREAAVGQRALQQARVGEAVLQARLQRGQARCRSRRSRCTSACDLAGVLEHQEGRAEQVDLACRRRRTRRPCRRPS